MGWRPGSLMLDFALALALLGLLLAGGMTLVPEGLDRHRDRLTTQRLERASLALMATLAATGALPCPADAEGPGPDWQDSACPTRPAGATAEASSLYAHGLLPWWRLGLMEEDALDGWGRRLGYAVSLAYVEGGVICGPAALADPRLVGAVPILGRDKTAWPPASDRAAFALVAQGPNGRGAITRQGSRRAADGWGAASAAEDANAPPPSVLPLRDGALTDPAQALHASPDPTDPAAASFDDRLLWHSRDSLLMALGCLDG